MEGFSGVFLSGTLPLLVTLLMGSSYEDVIVFVQVWFEAAQPRIPSMQTFAGSCSALMLDGLKIGLDASFPAVVVQLVETVAAALFKGVRNGLWSALAALSRRRRLLAGVDITWLASNLTFSINV